MQRLRHKESDAKCCLNGVAFLEKVVQFALRGSPRKVVVALRLSGAQQSKVVLFQRRSFVVIRSCVGECGGGIWRWGNCLQACPWPILGRMETVLFDLAGGIGGHSDILRLGNGEYTEYNTWIMPSLDRPFS